MFRMRVVRPFRLVVSIGLASVLLAGPAFAQQRERRGPGGGRDTEQRIATMTERLELTEKQQEEIRKIFEAREVAAREMMKQGKDGSLDRDARRKQMMEFREATQKEVEAVLDESQVEKYRNLRSKRREAMEKRRQERPGRGGPNAPSVPRARTAPTDDSADDE